MKLYTIDEFSILGTTITDNEVEGKSIEYVGFTQSEWEHLQDQIKMANELLSSLKELIADKYLCDPINKERMKRANAIMAKCEGWEA